MSKSYKKNPVIKQEKVDKKWCKKAVRKYNPDELLRGSQYKKVVTSSYWKYIWTEEQAIRDYNPSKYYPTLDSYMEYWKRLCLRK